MKFKAIIFGLITLAFVSCEDDLNSVGENILPEEDNISVSIDTISFNSSTISVDSIFLKTIEGCLGSFDDPVYGNVEYGYLSNFYASPDSSFKHKVIDDRIDSVILSIAYTIGIGDSLQPMEATVYGIPEGKTIDKNFYSNVNPWDYASKDLVWAKQSYTARNMNIPDTTYAKSSGHYIDFYLPVHVGQRLYNAWINNRDVFSDLDKFFNFFPGVYIASTSGSGNVINTYSTNLIVYYTTKIQSVLTEQVDSTVVRYALFRSTEEVTQLNKLESKKEDDQKLIDDVSRTYIKTPSGVITQLEIPLKKIASLTGNGGTFNNVKISLQAETQSDWQYRLPMPSTLLLINPDSVKTFFEKARLPENTYSYAASLNSTTLKYDFGNISVLIQNTINDLNNKGINPDDWEPLKLYVMPVELKLLSNTSSSPTITTNYFKPSGVKLKTGADNLKLYITTTKTK